jgi:arsenical pump membrane protein
VIAAIALFGLCVYSRRVPWRDVPVPAVALALALGTLALCAASALHVERVLAVGGLRGDALMFGTVALGANAVNNLPAVLLALPGLHMHHARVWSVLLGANLGPTLWVTGALSTLLWQSMMARLGIPVSARKYAALGVRVGIPVLVAALATHLALQALT